MKYDASHVVRVAGANSPEITGKQRVWFGREIRNVMLQVKDLSEQVLEAAKFLQRAKKANKTHTGKSKIQLSYMVGKRPVADLDDQPHAFFSDSFEQLCEFKPLEYAVGPEGLCVNKLVVPGFMIEKGWSYEVHMKLKVRDDDIEWRCNRTS
eukprot:TRINITY_DN46969_c0_g1_i1.p1 TRINITY_DN46969_c0_g1~~TRINITY_DN46969_c0_g1_i1.p1  ORF type:complete len:152 (+),score=38.16 TRINITY_DN46969_c0_g1_i1:188-643(+)